MKLGITKEQLPAALRHFGGMIAGAGIGMFLAVAFIPEDERKIFHFRYFVTAGILIIFGSVVGSFRQKKQEKDLDDDKPVA
jgi:uncharacterized membrane protein AbrB (regulator of aidB expression)